MLYLVCYFVLLASVGEVSGMSLDADKGHTLVLFPNVTFDKRTGCLALYLNGGKRQPILRAKWGLEHCRGSLNNNNIFMDENNNVWIQNVSEKDEGIYALKIMPDVDIHATTILREVNLIVHRESLSVGKGDTIVLFRNVTFDKTKGCLTLYLNGGKRQPILRAKWGLEHCRGSLNTSNIFMDENNNIWVHNVIERDEGIYALKIMQDDDLQIPAIVREVKLIVYAPIEVAITEIKATTASPAISTTPTSDVWYGILAVLIVMSVIMIINLAVKFHTTKCTMSNNADIVQKKIEDGVLDHEPNNDQEMEEPEKVHEIEETQTALLCTICHENLSVEVFLPCGHQVACPNCAKSVKTCIICKNVVNGLMKPYFA